MYATLKLCQHKTWGKQVPCRQRQRESNRWVQEKHSTFFQLRPKLSYDIFHQKGAALSVAANMLLSWLLTEREGRGECDAGVKLCWEKLCSSCTEVREASSRLGWTHIHTVTTSCTVNKSLVHIVSKKRNGKRIKPFLLFSSCTQVLHNKFFTLGKDRIDFYANVRNI